jgi:hypothetical protein
MIESADCSTVPVDTSVAMRDGIPLDVFGVEADEVGHHFFRQNPAVDVSLAVGRMTADRAIASESEFEESFQILSLDPRVFLCTFDVDVSVHTVLQYLCVVAV